MRAPWLWTLPLLAALPGCAPGPSASGKRTVNALLAQQKYAEAEVFLETAKQAQYGVKNQVLFYLDKAVVQHHAGKYKESDESLDKAERRMEELFTKSVSQSAGTLLLNDTTMEYAGEPFERALVNVLRALNYVFMGRPDEALVESRKVEAFLDELARRVGGSGIYSDDAFARYLDAMLYADQGKRDDARISLEAARGAYANYATSYGTPEPRFEFPPSSEPRGELVFIHYNGVAPRKVSKSFQVAWGQALLLTKNEGDSKDARFENALKAGFAGKAVTVAYPEFVQEPYGIVGSEVWVDSAPAGSTLLMEDISAIAAKQLQDRMALVKTRAIARATVKYVLAETAAKAAAKACDRMPGGYLAVQTCKMASRGAAHGAAAASEVADTRSWSTVPAQIRMARLKLSPGKHDIVVRFKDGAGVVVASQVFAGVEISPKKRTYLTFRTAR